MDRDGPQFTWVLAPVPVLGGEVLAFVKPTTESGEHGSEVTYRIATQMVTRQQVGTAVRKGSLGVSGFDPVLL